MGFLTTIIEYEGALANVRPRYWAAHSQAIATLGWRGPTEDEFWRLVRTGAPDGLRVPYAKSAAVFEYARERDARLVSSELMAIDEAWPDARTNAKLLKDRGTCHIASLCPNRDGLNAALDRMDLWMFFEKKQVLPTDSDRRVETLRELASGTRTMAVAGSVPFAYAANEAGCRVVGLTRGLSFPKQMRQVGVDVFYESLEELTDALAGYDEDLQRIGVI